MQQAFLVLLIFILNFDLMLIKTEPPLSSDISGGVGAGAIDGPGYPIYLASMAGDDLDDP